MITSPSTDDQCAPTPEPVLMSSLEGHAIVLRPLHRCLSYVRHIGAHHVPYVMSRCEFRDITNGGAGVIDVYDRSIVAQAEAAFHKNETVSGVVTRTASGRPSHVLSPIPRGLIKEALSASTDLMQGATSDFNAYCASKIKSLRREERLTQEALADYLGLSVSGVSELENGKRAITVDTLYRLSVFFSVPMSTLVA